MYLNGKVNRRIDVLLDVLLKIEHDQFFQFELKHRLLQPNKQTFKIEDAHMRGLKILTESVNVSTCGDYMSKPCIIFVYVENF